MKTDLETMLVPPSASLLEALRAINDGAVEVAFVCEQDRRVVGLVTDGDIRRALLSGMTPDSAGLSQVMSRDFVSVGPGTSRAEVLDIMRARRVDQVPVLDERGRLVALHLLREFVTPQRRPNCAVIMAGGKGTRLRPITEQVPKPMVRVAGVPILERLVHHLVGAGVQTIYLAVNYLAHQIEDHFGDGADFGSSIHYLREEEPLGTAGALSLLPERPSHPFLVLNGDLVTQIDFGTMLDFHERKRFAATMGVKPYAVTVPFGVAEVDGDLLIDLTEKPTHQMLVNAGIYALDPGTLDLLPDGQHVSITDLLRECRAAGQPVGVHLIEEDWIDVGQPEQLRQARGA